MVCEAKVVRFFQEKGLNRSHRTQKSIGSDDDEDEDEDDNEDEGDEQTPSKTLKYNTVRGYKTALIDLWQHKRCVAPTTILTLMAAHYEL